MKPLFESGTLEVGCNYWASHAGTAMWHNWDPECVAADLKAIASRGMTVIRVFPLWQDFQPLKYIRGGGNSRMGVGLDDNLLTPEEVRRGGTDPVMMERFRFLADEAQKNGIRMIVGLITGWMSGRYFAPPAFLERNALSDPETILWEVRFVRFFVKSFRDHKAIAAWDLGNECNCMGGVDRPAAWCWTNTISSAIRLEDPTRPVVSGMHSLQANEKMAWTIYDQGELTDVLTTHPYPLFTPNCSKAPFNTYPGTYHASAESNFYEDLGGKPCFAEEAGSLGPMIACDERAGLHVQSALASAWVHDLRAYLWWCGFDQVKLTHVPYDNTALERELGLFRTDRSAKPVADAMLEFRKMLKKLPFEHLPKRTINAVCVIGKDPDRFSWTTAFGAFQIAKQSGIELKYAYCTKEIPESGFYILPSMNSDQCIPGLVWHELIDRVKQGASLLMTEYTGMIEPFRSVFSARVDYRCMIPRVIEAVLPDGSEFKCKAPMTQKLLPENAEVMLKEKDGTPLLVRNNCGKGQVFFLNAPIENEMAENGGDFSAVYKMVFERVPHNKLFISKDIGIGITEHCFENGNTAVVLVNYSDIPGKAVLADADGEVFFGKKNGAEISLAGNSMAVVFRKANP